MRVYVAGKYNDSNVISVLRNMRIGITQCVVLLHRGHSPFCPWLDFQFGLAMETSINDFKRYSMEWLEVSDAILMLPNWNESGGAIEEKKRAEQLSIPVYYDLDEIPDVPKD